MHPKRLFEIATDEFPFYGFIMPVVFGMALRLFPPSIFRAQPRLEMILLFSWMFALGTHVFAWILGTYDGRLEGHVFTVVSDVFIIVSILNLAGQSILGVTAQNNRVFGSQLKHSHGWPLYSTGCTGSGHAGWHLNRRR